MQKPLPASSAEPMRNDFPKLKTKTLLLRVDGDRGVSVQCGLLFSTSLPTPSFSLFDQCDHWVQWDQADRFNCPVADFSSVQD